MDADQAREISERDQLWASLRVLRPQIDQLARGEFEATPQQLQLVTVLARIVTAELDFRARAANPE